MSSSNRQFNKEVGTINIACEWAMIPELEWNGR